MGNSFGLMIWIVLFIIKYNDYEIHKLPEAAKYLPVDRNMLPAINIDKIRAKL